MENMLGTRPEERPLADSESGGLTVFLIKERGSGKRLQSRREWKEANTVSVLLLAAEPT